MNALTVDELRAVGLIVAGVMAITLFLALALLLIAFRRLRELDIPPDADFTETLLRPVVSSAGDRPA